MRLFDFYLSHGLVRVCEIEFSHMGKNSGNSDLVSKNTLSTSVYRIQNLYESEFELSLLVSVKILHALSFICLTV